MKIVRIGRDRANDVVVDDPLVSRSHCQIIQDEYGGFTIIDNSTNGTFINGTQIGKGSVTRLNEKDIVRIGNEALPWTTFFEEVAPMQPSSRFPADKPANFLAWAILTTVFFFLPFGIVSIVKASKVDDLWYAGYCNEAQMAAHSARLWFWWSFGVGIVLNIIWLIFNLLFWGFGWLFSTLSILL